MSIVLINPFEVPLGQEENFRQGWQAAAEHLRQAPGFISTRLHESLDKEARFRFINVAEWESPQHFQAAMRSEAMAQVRQHMHFTAYPALYQVIVEEKSSSSH
ncbi:antibiotic biosynthesis monooxygenase [Ktedonosporobacter rubrisoli]|uniref:Antibiotic biosynthesis monooxygenase n=1 Tax=Ktedonosporobacter rubrisoli TaxID=2509675 RepID=A0A4P6JU49_KTERU|nr:antibiotic biosynthesis monooxygenase family protein [Ktedonosporobacter rubrisoli]QBD78984.1 antibiotic biosynthesis monooxygenase [Ktedonosporobacter rubrisoli]